MKYMILAFASQHDYEEMEVQPSSEVIWTDEELTVLRTFVQRFNQELSDSGELVDTNGLNAPVDTRRVQLKEGVPVVTLSPYAEAEKVLGHYWIVDCDSFERATEIASRLASFPGPKQVQARSYWDVRPIYASEP